MTAVLNNKIRVLHVIPSLALGGTPRLLLDLAARLHKTGNYEVHICVLGRSSMTCEKYRPVVQPVYLECPCQYRKPLQMLGLMHKLRKHIQTVKPDIVHSYLWLADVLTAAAVFKTDSSHVSHVVDRRTSFSSSRWKHQLKKYMVRYFLRRAETKYIAVSAACSDYVCRYLGVPERSVSIAYNSIDPELYPFREHNMVMPVRIGTAGRMVDEKGHVYLLEAARHLKDQNIDYRLLIDGDGPLCKSLESRVASLGLSDQVEFRGFMKNMQDFYSELDIFVVASLDSEGLPTTLLEAMASGCAVVSTDVGGSCEAVRNGREGLLVPPRSAQAIADSIVSFINNEPLRRHCVLAARERVVGQFTLKRMTSDVIQAYDRLMEKTS